MTETDHPKFDISQVTENIFLGTNLCCLEKSHIQILLDVNIEAEVNLEEVRQQEAPEVLMYLWLPTADHQSPTAAQIKVGVAFIDSVISQGKKVFIHCKNGHGRSPTLVAAYLMSKGKSLDQAINEIKQARPEIHLEEAQLDALRNIAI